MYNLQKLYIKPDVEAHQAGLKVPTVYLIKNPTEAKNSVGFFYILAQPVI